MSITWKTYSKNPSDFFFCPTGKLPQHTLINIENDDDDDWTEHWRYKNYRTYLHEAYITTHCLTTLDLLPLDFIQ